MVRRHVRAAVSEVAADVLSGIRADAGWSTRIPRATKMRTTFGAHSAGAGIVTSARQAPHARPLQFGSHGNPGYDRHPVFGKPNVRVNQPIRPFFFDAAVRQGPAFERRMADAIAQTLRDMGF